MQVRYRVILVNDEAKAEELQEIKMWYPAKGYWNASL